mmetsp:Transcript_24290/g.52036  ORF Transcript_24290/g.52036 Transcript_24290/m.52036 type:complete len:87 (+) Transcript_24290:51-311(+)
MATVPDGSLCFPAILTQLKKNFSFTLFFTLAVHIPPIKPNQQNHSICHYLIPNQSDHYLNSTNHSPPYMPSCRFWNSLFISSTISA